MKRRYIPHHFETTGVSSKMTKKKKKNAHTNAPPPNYTESNNRKQGERVYRVWLANPVLRDRVVLPSDRWKALFKRFKGSTAVLKHFERVLGVPVVLQLSLHELRKTLIPQRAVVASMSIHVRDVRKVAGWDDVVADPGKTRDICLAHDVVAGFQSISEPSCEKL
jgi:hypothetical protein